MKRKQYKKGLSNIRAITILITFLISVPGSIHAAQLHVSTKGKDRNPGTMSQPLRTIQRAADLAHSGDTITVHRGTYRERVNPLRGGESEDKRIVYQAASGEKVEIKGSEVIKGWELVRNGVWKKTLPNTFFKNFNPYDDMIIADWFRPRDRNHHTGTVYLNGEWLIEAATLEDVLDPDGSKKLSKAERKKQPMLNVAWFRPLPGPKNAGQIPATHFSNFRGVETIPSSEGGNCVSSIEHGDWIQYKNVDFGEFANKVEIRAASGSRGGIIEVRLNSRKGKILGYCFVPNTGGWQSWNSFIVKIWRPVSGVKKIYLSFRIPKPKKPRAGNALWYARVDDKNTTIWAQFGKADPNKETAEINVRQTIFYPDKPGINYITVRGFIMRHAAPKWAPPTAEQMGLIGTHWSKGWIIENNIISHSINVGLSLGKYGDEFDNIAPTADAYNNSVERALENGWQKGNIGHHLIKNNSISYCEQAGIVGSMGASFSKITGNHIFKIHIQGRFTGAEMAGIKFHAPVDVLIKGNRIHDTSRALWLDWMTQGTRVTRNLFYGNGGDDVFLEVNHGPCLVDNNLFLSRIFRNRSEGGAFVHNLFAGGFSTKLDLGRETPYFKPHSTDKAGLHKVDVGDDRFYNNMFVGKGRTKPPAASRKSRKKPAVVRGVSGRGLFIYDEWPTLLQTGGNIYYYGAHPFSKELDFMSTQIDPAIRVEEREDNVYLHITLDPKAGDQKTKLVTTELLGKAKIPQARFENADGTPITIDIDYFGKKRNDKNPTAGPFENPGAGSLILKVWQQKKRK